ncbi:hypothetical protein [Paraburkholderia youngii]|uniref:hypothetical protein n=1 Tax=Paraburkholderia youngii TaxID=2782701 RepID=UPI003D239D78
MRALLERFRRAPSEIASGHATYIGAVLSAFDEADNPPSSSPGRAVQSAFGIQPGHD